MKAWLESESGDAKKSEAVKKDAGPQGPAGMAQVPLKNINN